MDSLYLPHMVLLGIPYKVAFSCQFSLAGTFKMALLPELEVGAISWGNPIFYMASFPLVEKTGFLKAWQLNSKRAGIEVT